MFTSATWTVPSSSATHTVPLTAIGGGGNGSKSEPRRLTPDQMALVLREHYFVPMAGTKFCLLCFALDHFRESCDHGHVISEE